MTDARNSEGGAEGPFFIVGCGRSGTTLVATMLNAHPELDVPRVEALYDIYGPFVPIPPADIELTRRQWQRLLTVLASDAGVRAWDHPPSPADLPREPRHRNFAAAYRALHEFHARRSGCRVWGAKMVGGEKRISRLISDFPRAKFIYCLRDPRAVAGSLVEADFGPTTLQEAAQTWVESVRLLEEARRKHSDWRFLTLRYEDLVRNPHRNVAELLRFLGVAWHDGVESYSDSAFARRRARSPEHANLARPPDAALIDRRIAKMTPTEIAEIELIIADQLVHQGYTRVGPPPSGPPRPRTGRRSLRETTRRVMRYLLTADPVRRRSFIQRHFRRWLYAIWPI